MSGIIKFCKKYKEKKINDADLAVGDTGAGFGYIRKINFHVGYTEYAPMMSTLGEYPTILDLDQEDIDYLYNKYSKQLREEKKRKLQKIEDEYKI